MRILLLIVFSCCLWITSYGQVADSSQLPSERMGKRFGLERAKINKLYHINKKLEQDRTKVTLQFKPTDTLGRRLAYGRLERKKDEQYQEILTKEQYRQYRENKKQFMQ